MSDSGKAVFLSYASQDAEAAKRICEALRAAGVEVWFDQSELVGGDAWDQKIRKQIKDCALLIPVISASTQARHEGYFRLEWRLADQRTHLMGRSKAFLLPVSIDGTRDADADVPDSFVAVQWTKAPGGAVPPAFVARVKQLLDGNADNAGNGGGASHPSTTESSGPKAPPTKETARWLKPVLAAAAIVIAVLAFTLIKRGNRETSAGPIPATPVPAAPAESEARQLAEKAWRLACASSRDSQGMSTALAMADRAIELDKLDGEVWARAARVDLQSWVTGFEQSEARKAQIRIRVARAKSLAARSIRGRMAEALMLTLFDGPAGLTEAERILRGLEGEKLEEPDASDVQGGLGSVAIGRKQYLEAARLYERAGQHQPGWMNAASYAYLKTGNFTAAAQAAEKQMALDRAGGILQLAMVQFAASELDAAKATLERLPPEFRRDELAVTLQCWIAYLRRDLDDSLTAMEQLPGDFVRNVLTIGPKRLITGLIRHEAGQAEAARLDWEAALRLVEQRLAEDNVSGDLLWSKFFLLSALKREDEARQVSRLMRELKIVREGQEGAFYFVLLNDREQALHQAELQLRDPDRWVFQHVILRYDPKYDMLRGDPRFERALRDTLPKGAKPFDDPPRPVLPTVDAKSVAVLAFANLSDDKANEYFSDGISEELLNVLAKIPDLKVSARTSAFSFKGKDTPVPEIARQLGVAYVVEGSVRKQGDKVRITAQLIKASDGFHVWSDTFDRDLRNIFAVQDEIAGLIAKNLSLKLGMASPAAARTVDPEAYRLMLLGRDLLYRGSAGDLAQAERYLQDAVGRDEKFALAWAWLSITRWAQTANGWKPIDAGFKSAREAAEKALALQPDLPEANSAVGFIYYGYDWDWARARAAFDRALALAPGDAVVLSNLTRLAITLGENDEAVRLGRQAVALDPLNSYAQYVLSMALLQAGRFAELEQQVMDFKNVTRIPAKQQVFALVLLGKNEAALQVAGEFKNDNNRTFVLALANWACGHRAEADAGLARLKTEYATTAAYQIAELHAYRGEPDEAFAWLETSYRQRDTGMIYLKNDPWLKSLHADPRWPVLLRQMNLADDQQP